MKEYLLVTLVMPTGDITAVKLCSCLIYRGIDFRVKHYLPRAGNETVSIFVKAAEDFSFQGIKKDIGTAANYPL